MKKFWVDFSASLLVEAKDENEAKEKFYRYLDKYDKNICFADIDCIEEKNDN